jgi:hypothetical protein
METMDLRLSNKPDAVNPAMTVLFQICSEWHGVTDPHRSLTKSA